MSLWTWALAAWGKPGVERACLDLQDRAGQSVALLLWRAWCAGEGRPADRALSERAAALARPLETDILGPMRAARRALSEERPGLHDRVRHDAHEQLRAVELVLERNLLEALEVVSAEPARQAEADLAAAFWSLMEIWGFPLPKNEARALAAALVRALA